METEKYPLCVLLFSGKRKSGKDYFTDKLLELTQRDKFVVVKISAPIKSHFSETYNLNLNDLMSSGEYKEKYRTEMILWSDDVRKKDPGIFCQSAVEMYNAITKPIWIVSDVRRKTDIKWFREKYGDVVKTIRIEADEDVRRKRGWVFTKGVDDVTSECDLDNFVEWDWKINNNGEETEFQVSLSNILQYLSKMM